MTARFLVAKYVPDLARMEPRNIGVIVWNRGRLRTRFLPPDEAEFVDEKDTYRRWTAFWERAISGESIRPSRGKPVPVADPECLDALVATQKGNYLLVDAGEFLHPIARRDLSSATDYLFDDLVALRHAKDDTTRRSFSQRCERLLKAARLPFVAKKAVACRWRGIERPIHPDYYVGTNGHPDAILLRAELRKERSVNNAAHMALVLTEGEVVPAEKCRVLYRGGELGTTAADHGLDQLRALCDVIDVDDSSAEFALSSFRESLAIAPDAGA